MGPVHDRWLSSRCSLAQGWLSSIAVCGRGASFNIPVARSGGPRTTVGVPGTGLSWSVEHTWIIQP